MFLTRRNMFKAAIALIAVRPKPQPELLSAAIDVQKDSICYVIHSAKLVSVGSGTVMLLPTGWTSCDFNRLV